MDNGTNLYRKKPVVIEARQFATEADAAPLVEWMRANPFPTWHALPWTDDRDTLLCISTLEGIMTASLGDWVIRGVQGEFYPCKPDIFDATYEAVSD